MPGDVKQDIAKLYDAESGDYHQMYQRENLEKGERYPANYFRLQIQVRRLASSNVKRVYEVGVGEGTPLVTMAKMGFDVAGCDISQAMVAKARRNFKAQGLSEDLIQWGDIEDSATLTGHRGSGLFDAVIAAGVMPHVRNDRLFLENLKMLLRPGGKVLIEFRNKLFSLFTMNRYTKQFILDDLLGPVSGEIRDRVAGELDKRLAIDLPKPRRATGDGPSYDAILAKFHNPFELEELYASAGFRNFRLHWYHYHPAPPMLESGMEQAFRQAAMALEHEGSWRGMFLCSAGVAEADLEGEVQTQLPERTK
jgi:2-polyprenyl-3-methyl-5-hydroxy-6-metoxy-1,4-benzoquinol methylase